MAASTGCTTEGGTSRRKSASSARHCADWERAACVTAPMLTRDVHARGIPASSRVKASLNL